MIGQQIGRAFLQPIQPIAPQTFAPPVFSAPPALLQPSPQGGAGGSGQGQGGAANAQNLMKLIQMFTGGGDGTAAAAAGGSGAGGANIAAMFA